MSFHDDLGEKIFSRRAFVLGALQFAGLCVLGGRLAWLQIAQGQRYKMLSDKNRINIKLIAPLRGEIVDRFGVPLAVNIQQYRLLIIPEQVQDLNKALLDLQKTITLDDRTIKRVKKEAGDTAKFIPLLVKDDLTWGEVAKIEVNLTDFSGVSIDTGDVRIYPYEHATAHIVGYVRAVSLRDLEQGDPLLKLPGFKVGKTGVEKVYDPKLRGRAGITEVEVNVVGREIRELKRQVAPSGKRVTLSLDGELQRYTQEVLAQHRSASAVVMDAHSGAVYALASHPSFDPNSFVHGLSTQEWEELMNDPTLPQTNKALSGQYPPGSTFKMITALAGLKAGVIDKNTRVYCPGHYEFGGNRFHCWKKSGHGSVNLYQALEQSCDTYFYKMSTEVGVDAIADMARSFGLGDTLGFELSEEAPGLMPTTQWAKQKLGRSWKAGETINVSIGQGQVLTTPLQLAVMTARLVNGGREVKPWITEAIGDEVLHDKDLPWKEMGVDPKHLELVLRGMERVTNNKKGTAHASRILHEGHEMGGKTGTAQVRRITKEQRFLGVQNKDLPWESRHHALFVGYAPTSKPRYVCSVVVEHGVGGSSAAAPLAKLLLEETQNRDPARSL